MYFLSDSVTTTSLINLKYIRKIEPGYAGRIRFSYICKYDPDSLYRAVSKFEKGSAIALINYYHNSHNEPLNPEAINLEVIKRSPVPVFMESETLLGKGIAGGIFIRGREHGIDVANLALRFIDNPFYAPAKRVTRPENRYYFDYRILMKFNIPQERLPAGSVVINKPHAVFIRYLKYIFALLVIIGLLLFILAILILNTRKRKKAEGLVKLKLQEIQEKNNMLEQAHQQVNDMNTELEEINEHLSTTNEELSMAKVKSEESDRLKSSFLANMSHEIRTPLNAIVGFSSLYNDPMLTASDRENYYKIINSNSIQLLNIIEDILDLSKIEAGQLNTNIEVFPVHELLADLVNSFSKNLEDTGVKLGLSTRNRNWHVMLRSDPARFNQIMSNLISNAIKFTKKGRIELGYDLLSDKEIAFYVKDTGIGISERDLPNVFNRFWKAENQIENFQSGTGLGLAICKSLCEALDADIRAESKKGEGTTFFVTFRDYSVMKDEPPSEEAFRPDYMDRDWSKFTIALVEDEISNMYLLTRILKNLKANLVTFKNGAEIVDFVHNGSQGQNRPDTHGSENACNGRIYCHPAHQGN